MIRTFVDLVQLLVVQRRYGRSGRQTPCISQNPPISCEGFHTLETILILQMASTPRLRESPPAGVATMEPLKREQEEALLRNAVLSGDDSAWKAGAGYFDPRKLTFREWAATVRAGVVDRMDRSTDVEKCDLFFPGGYTKTGALRYIANGCDLYKRSHTNPSFSGRWCMNRTNTMEINTLRFLQ